MANQKQLPREFISNYSGLLGNLTKECQGKMMEELARVDLSNVAQARDEIITIMQAYLGVYTDMAAEMSATFFDGVRAYQGVNSAYSAIAASGYDPMATEETVRGLMQIIVDDPAATGKLMQKLAQCATHCIKSAAANTTEYNVRKDPAKPRYARVPKYTPVTYDPWSKTPGVTHNKDLASHGTCPFCSMLASRGFVYYSRKAAGAGQHWHDGCDCVIVQSYNDAGAEYYDPEACLQDWHDSITRVAQERAAADGTDEFDEFREIERHYAQAGSESKYRDTEHRQQTQEYARVRYHMNRAGL